MENVFFTYEQGGAIMVRYCLDCRDHPSDVKCSMAFSADTKEELIDVVMDHGVKVHGMEDTPEEREFLANDVKKGDRCRA
jgi:predicted small metal-binding protein